MKYNLGDIVLVKVPFTNQKEYKLRPAFVWFEEYSNICNIRNNQQFKYGRCFFAKRRRINS